MSLRPSKHSNADLTTVAIATVLLGRLQQKRLVNYDGLRTFLVRKRPRAGDLFYEALGLLFLLGLVQYHPKGDSFEYTGK